MKKWLFNPFVYIAGLRALLIGLAIILLSAIVAFYSHTHFDGALDTHYGAPTILWLSFAEVLIDWVCLVIPLYLLGLIASDIKPRIVDVAGTVALARWPMFILALCGFLPVTYATGKVPSIDDIIALVSNPYFIIQSIFALGFIVWYVALLWNAFSVSTNLKKGKGVLTFIAGLLIAEILSIIVLKQFSGTYFLN